MADRSSWGGLFSRAARVAGRKYAETRKAYQKGRESGDPPADLPSDEDGNARIVCRRYVEKRTVSVDAAGRPECFEEDHPDCEGCAEDVREGRVETW
ncbi:hypothetical protein BRC81_06930 [Halobacteriales archaeon QS_1_68_20]|nr:MAG: hypothetical protein BRC81_06930 [Halobacteriales archaeon QS_1_68_20]